MGKTLRIKKGRPGFSHSIWKHTSENMNRLLINLARLTMTGWLTKSRAIRVLGNISDPRARPFLKHVAEVWINNRIHSDIREALDNIQYREFRHKRQAYSVITILDEIRATNNC